MISFLWINNLDFRYEFIYELNFYELMYLKNSKTTITAVSFRKTN